MRISVSPLPHITPSFCGAAQNDNERYRQVYTALEMRTLSRATQPYIDNGSITEFFYQKSQNLTVLTAIDNTRPWGKKVIFSLFKKQEFGKPASYEVDVHTLRLPGPTPNFEEALRILRINMERLYGPSKSSTLYPLYQLT